MKYTPEEVAKLLANRPNQPHYIEAMIRHCIDEAIRPSAEVVLAKGWYHFRKGEDGAADDYDLYDSTASPCADCIPVKIVRADSPSPADEAVRRDAERYRWLRDHGFQHAVVYLGTDFDGDNFVSYRIDFHLPEPAHMKFEDDEWDTADVDAAIDAAIAAHRKGGES